MIRIDCHVERLERCQTVLIAGTLEDVPTMKWRSIFAHGSVKTSQLGFLNALNTNMTTVLGYRVLKVIIPPSYFRIPPQMQPLEYGYTYKLPLGSRDPFEQYSSHEKRYEFSIPGYQPYGGSNYESASDYGRPFAAGNYPPPSSAQNQPFVAPPDTAQLPFSSHHQGQAPLPPTSPIESQIPGHAPLPPTSPIESQIPGQAPPSPTSPIETQVPGQAAVSSTLLDVENQIPPHGQGTAELGVKSPQIEVPAATPASAQIEPGPVPPAPPSHAQIEHGPVPPAPPTDAEISNAAGFGNLAGQEPFEPVTPPTTLARPRGMPSIHAE
ncbi:hypothetical protein Y032_0348g3168 [Ancylostoma ceylanicum]|nr:hypothetical protein Y032_0348g3168 [Ancylostoma ceylanicum]